MFNGADWCQHVRRAAGGAAGKEGSPWLRAAVFVNSAKGLPGPGLTMVGDGFSALVKSVWGDAGGHARVAPGVHGLPFNLPLVVEATVEVD